MNATLAMTNKPNESFENFDELEDEGDEEWNQMIELAMARAEASGVPFDHIMGAMIGGCEDAYGY